MVLIGYTPTNSICNMDPQTGTGTGRKVSGPAASFCVRPGPPLVRPGPQGFRPGGPARGLLARPARLRKICKILTFKF